MFRAVFLALKHTYNTFYTFAVLNSSMSDEQRDYDTPGDRPVAGSKAL